jgi:SAM-dependent methyltransferase
MQEKLDSLDIIKRYYDRLRSERGAGSAGVGYTSEEGQKMRFKALNCVGNLKGCTVLDVGSGLGHFARWCESQAIDITYVGIDVCYESLHHLKNAILGDAKCMPFADQVFDWTVACSIFNFDYTENDKPYIVDDIENPLLTAVLKVVREMFRVSRNGIAFNLLSLSADWFSSGNAYYDPTIVENALRQGSRGQCSIKLKQDYANYDFSIFVYRR